MTKKVLIIDDEILIATVFKKQLNVLANYSVDIALSGKDGLSRLKITDYDTLILDLIMPDIDGVEILKLLKKEYLDHYINRLIVLTNATSNEIAQNVRSLGVRHFFSKTDVRPQELIKTIENITEKTPIGEKIKMYRKRSKKSQLELALLCKMDSGHLSRIETGEIKPTNVTLRKIGSVLNLSKNELIDLFEL